MCDRLWRGSHQVAAAFVTHCKRVSIYVRKISSSTSHALLQLFALSSLVNNWKAKICSVAYLSIETGNTLQLANLLCYYSTCSVVATICSRRVCSVGSENFGTFLTYYYKKVRSKHTHMCAASFHYLSELFKEDCLLTCAKMGHRLWKVQQMSLPCNINTRDDRIISVYTDENCYCKGYPYWFMNFKGCYKIIHTF